MTEIDPKVTAAFMAFTLAIKEFLTHRKFPGPESIEKVAKDYGKNITDSKSMKVAALFFDWDELTKYLREQK